MTRIQAIELRSIASMIDTDATRLSPVTISGEDAIKAAAKLRSIAEAVVGIPPAREAFVQSIHDEIAKNGGYTIGALRNALDKLIPKAI